MEERYKLMDGSFKDLALQHERDNLQGNPESETLAVQQMAFNILVNMATGGVA